MKEVENDVQKSSIAITRKRKIILGGEDTRSQSRRKEYKKKKSRIRLPNKNKKRHEEPIVITRFIITLSLPSQLHHHLFYSVVVVVVTCVCESSFASKLKSKKQMHDDPSSVVCVFDRLLEGIRVYFTLLSSSLHDSLHYSRKRVVLLSFSRVNRHSLIVMQLSKCSLILS